MNGRTVERVVFLGEFGPVSLTFARSCHAMGISVYLVKPEATGSAAMMGSSRFVGCETLPPQLVGTAEGIKAVVEYTQRVGAQALAAVRETDCRWLARNRTQFDEHCTVLIPPRECLDLLESKVRQIALAQRAGFSTLPTHVIRSPGDIEGIDGGCYPLCLRPATPTAVEPSFKVLKVNSPDEFRRRIRELRIFRDAIIAQPFLVLPNMVIHAASYEGGELMRAAAFLVDRKFEGLALRLRPMTLTDGLTETVRQFSRTVKLSGAYHFDLLYALEREQTYYLEVNARFGGTTDKVFWLGVDEPADCLRAYGLTGPRRRRSNRVWRAAVANKRATLKHLLTMLQRGPEPWDYPQESRFKAAMHSIGDLVLTKDSIYDRKDLRGSAAFHLQGFSRFL